jgi:hypothetical protein
VSFFLRHHVFVSYLFARYLNLSFSGMREMQEQSAFFGAMATKAHEHRLRCRRLPPIQSGEVERLVADFLATRDITSCPPRFAAPVEERIQSARSGI